MANFFTRRRYKPNAAPIAFVRATILTPGAEGFAPVPTHADPPQYRIANDLTQFTPMMAWQGGGLINQGLALPDMPYQGFPWDEYVSQAIVDPDNYPNIYPGIIDEEPS